MPLEQFAEKVPNLSLLSLNMGAVTGIPQGLVEYRVCSSLARPVTDGAEIAPQTF
jgi:hypothetical protein